jgi:hypothetical protein
MKILLNKNLLKKIKSNRNLQLRKVKKEMTKKKRLIIKIIKGVIIIKRLKRLM